MTPSHFVRTLQRVAIAATAIFLAAASLPPRAVAQTPEPPGRAARVSSAIGAVSLLAAGDSGWTTAPLNYTVMGGDRLNTGLNSRAELEVGSLALRLSEDTDVDVTNLSDRLTQIGISRGVLRLSVYRLLPTDVIRIETPDGAVTVRALGQYRVSVDHARTVVSVDNARWTSTPGHTARRFEADAPSCSPVDRTWNCGRSGARTSTRSTGGAPIATAERWARRAAAT
jgi:hypothetical protein